MPALVAAKNTGSTMELAVQRKGTVLQRMLVKRACKAVQ